MTKLVRSLKEAPRALLGSSKARGVLAVLLLAAAVVSSLFGLTVGLVQTLILLCYLALMVSWYRDNREELLRWGTYLVGSGIVLGVVQIPTVDEVADTLMSVGICLIASYVALILTSLLLLHVRRIPDASRAASVGFKAWLSHASRPTVAEPGVPLGGAFYLALAISIGLSAILAVSAGLSGGPWRLIGPGVGSSVWNVHVLEAPMLRVGHQLLDASVISRGGTAAFVAIPDSPLLDALKLLHPGNLSGPAVINLVIVLSVWGFLVGAFMFLRIWVRDTYACAAAALLLLGLPLGYDIRTAAPLDMVLPLLVAALAAQWVSPIVAPVLVAVSLLSGFANAAGGYELALLSVMLRLFGYIRSTPLAVGIATAGLASSVLGAWIVYTMAPAVSLREAWWSSAELVRILGVEGVQLSSVEIALALAAVVAGGMLMAAMKEWRAVYFAVALFVVSAVLAVPSHLGGVPLLVPSHALDAMAPAGWPTARFLELSLLAAAIPITYAFARLFEGFLKWAQRSSVSTALAWALAAMPVLALLPRALPARLPPEDGSRVAIFPIAQAGSSGSVWEADALLRSGATLLQSNPYVTGSPLRYGEAPGAQATVTRLRRLGVQKIVLQYALYADPASLTVEPQLYGPRDYLEPELQVNPGFRIERLTANAEIYDLISHGSR
ncbi:MAG: hypothetical protein ACYC8W_03490 [Candidatus Tyrphobacter sp.]